MSANAERDRVLDEAIAAGKFPETRRAVWARHWDRDPEATRKVIAELAAVPGLDQVADTSPPEEVEDPVHEQIMAGFGVRVQSRPTPTVHEEIMAAFGGRRTRKDGR